MASSKTVTGNRNTLLILTAGLLVGAGLGVLILFGIGSLNSRGPQLAGGAIQSPVLDAAAPDFELETLDGERLRLSELRGRPVLINFWATWCGPCLVEMPVLEKYYQKYPDRFALLAVNAGEQAGEIRDFVEDKELTFDILLDPQNKVQNLYRLRGYPTSFLIDAEGIIRVHHIGPVSEAQLQAYLPKVGVGQ